MPARAACPPRVAERAPRHAERTLSRGFAFGRVGYAFAHDHPGIAAPVRGLFALAFPNAPGEGLVFGLFALGHAKKRARAGGDPAEAVRTLEKAPESPVEPGAEV